MSSAISPGSPWLKKINYTWLNSWSGRRIKLLIVSQFRPRATSFLSHILAAELSPSNWKVSNELGCSCKLNGGMLPLSTYDKLARWPMCGFLRVTNIVLQFIFIRIVTVFLNLNFRGALIILLDLYLSWKSRLLGWPENGYV